MPEVISRKSNAGTWLGLLALPFLPGCLIPFGFPTTSVVPPVELGAEIGPVYAFRVDSTRKWVDSGGTDNCTLTLMPVPTTGWAPPQTRVSMTYGYLMLGIALNYPVFTSHSVAVCLYRPGYQLIEINSWAPPSKPSWQKAQNLEAQERTLDRLFLFEDEQTTELRQIRSRLDGGSASAAHREALIFGATEYERLATSEQALRASAEKTCKRLIDKVSKLRALAAR